MATVMADKESAARSAAEYTSRRKREADAAQQVGLPANVSISDMLEGALRETRAILRCSGVLKRAERTIAAAAYLPHGAISHKVEGAMWDAQALLERCAASRQAIAAYYIHVLNHTYRIPQCLRACSAQYFETITEMCTDVCI